MSKSNYLEDLILNWETGTPMPAPPVGIYLALFNENPTDTGLGGTEVTTTIRPAGRLAVTFGAIVTGGGPNTKANTVAVNFGAAVGGATMSHFATFDAASGGNMLRWGALSGGSQSVSVGTLVNFAIGALVISED